MVPLIKSGQKVTLAPIGTDEVLKAQDIVLCTVKGSQYLHLIKACDGNRFQIGNNRGGINGWTQREKIHGRLIRIEP